MPISALELSFTIRGFDCGYGGPLRVLSLADMLQEAAGVHAESLGWGKDAMGESSRTWMMSRSDTRVYRSPREGETVIVRTWPSGIQRLFALRDFQIEAEDGEVLAAASYAYLIIDINARRPLRPEGILSTDLISDRPRSLPDARYTAEKPEAPWSESFNETASSRHIDHNGHVNNAHLYSWLCDAPPPDARGTGTLCAMNVEFAQEVLLGDTVQAVWAPLPARDSLVRHTVELRRGGETCVRAELAWR
jgi:acyl-ACP thioesterase